MKLGNTCNWCTLLRSFESVTTCVNPESFARRGPTLTTFFLVNEGRDYPNTSISVPSSARQRNAIYDGQTLNAGLVAL